jgi:hypothetical protein
VGSDQTFLLGPRERTRLVAGWRVGQVIIVGLGTAAAMVCVSISSSTPGVVAGVIAVALSLLLASIPLRGRVLDEWVPTVMRYQRHHGDERLASFQVVEAELPSGARAGVIERGDGTVSVILSVECTGISLLGSEEANRRIDGFVAALASAARHGSVIDRASWSMWSRPADPDALLRDLRERGNHGSEETKDAYRSLLHTVAAHGVKRQVAVTLRAPLRGRSDAVSALLEEAASMAQGLQEGGHQRVALASRGEIVAMFSDRFGAEVFAGVGEDDEVSVALSAELDFGDLRCGSQVATSWWIAEWPRHEVGAELLAPLLLSDPNRSMSVVVEPVPASLALRRAQSAKTTGAADDELRRRGGFLLDRRREREADHLLAREAELVDGHGSIRMTGYISTVAEDRAQLASQIADVELGAAQAQLTLLRLQGDHGRGYLATLPLAGGLP